MSSRPPAVAGLFYPAEPAALRRAVEDYLAAAQHRTAAASPRPKAIVVPHAGYVYSGPIAASAYAGLVPYADQLSRVVLLGPSHRVAFAGLAYPAADAFATPLGTVAVDRDAYRLVDDLPQVQPFDRPFDDEHCLEVQLPFLQTLLPAFRLVPFLVGDARAEQVAQVIDRLWGGDETLVVISSDLTHYLDYDTAKDIDAATSRAIEALRPEDIGVDQACGRNPLRGLLTAARGHGLRAKTLDLRSSGDTAGPPQRVVGYGAYAFYP